MFWFQRNTTLSMLQGLADMLRHAKQQPEYFELVKVALCRCSDVYEISFMRPGEDVYGRDIDLTARLLALAGEGEILMNEAFHAAVIEHHSLVGDRQEFEAVGRIQGPWSQNLKGFRQPVQIYKVPPISRAE